ncbi:amino acid ABC transporter permease [Tropicimonas sp. TH_r6]|uniref:amino acid ABC transporter permease n=1 Tax=Tropicimonas sp. TH_r6 TaxID=3082085 RepID=UPI002954C4FC|nr:amino acid ABC transporter permease [Tropicimonas sp. TH_r6]MDV7142049.1 amino acid ABC transporter permease [Tropicimonas sp. TH_r6]
MIPRNKNDEREFPWWLVVAGALGAFFLYRILADDLYRQVLTTLSRGVGITLFVTAVAFTSACLIGLGLAVASLSRYRLLRELARFYTEILRGLPILVLLLYVAFVIAPGMVAAINWVLEGLGQETIRTRDFSLLWRAIVALTLGYSAFIAEVFRAGLLSVDEGQVEAAKALGLNGWHRFRFIVFPQAIRTILPPLGNDFIAMIKDSSLVSVLGVLDITQLGKVTAAGNFHYFETYNVVAFLYLTMTVTLSLLLRRLERHMRRKPG